MKLFEDNEWDEKRETLGYNQRAFQARVQASGRNARYFSAYYTTREEAVADADMARPRAKLIASGYGYHGGFDIRFHKRSYDKTKLVEV